MAKLAKRQAREETGLFLLEGPQAVREALAARPDHVTEVYGTPAAFERHGDIADAARGAGVPVHLAGEQVLEAMADTVAPQGVVAIARQFPAELAEVLAHGPRLVAVCDQVRDPGNLGTIIRAADAVGADAVVLTGRTVDPFNPKVVRATTGSLFHVPICRGADVGGVIDQLRRAGLRVVAADVKGRDLPTARAELRRPTAWLFGNEAHGLDDDALARADTAVRLPIYGAAESLNLAIAAGVCLYASAFAQRLP